MGRALRMSPVSHGLQESGKGRAHTARMWEAAWLKRIRMGCAVVVPGAAGMGDVGITDDGTTGDGSVGMTSLYDSYCGSP